MKARWKALLWYTHKSHKLCRIGVWNMLTRNHTNETIITIWLNHNGICAVRIFSIDSTLHISVSAHATLGISHSNQRGGKQLAYRLHSPLTMWIWSIYDSALPFDSDQVSQRIVVHRFHLHCHKIIYICMHPYRIWPYPWWRQRQFQLM